MSDKAKQPGASTAQDRRHFLKALTGVGVAGAAAAVTVTEVAEAQSSRSDRESRDERVKARYQADSPDVQAFYRTNRY